MFSTLRHPFLIDCKLGEIAIWGNGNLVNAGLLRKDLVDHGFIFGAPAATPKSSCTSAGKITWPHGFHLRRWKFKPGYSTLWHSRDEEEVILVQSGRLTYVWAGGELEMQAGDVLTAPIAQVRQYVSGEDETAIAYVVRGGDSPSQYTPAAN